jgi:hypothetical protein
MDEAPNPTSDHYEAQDTKQPGEDKSAHIKPPLSMDDCFSLLGLQSEGPTPKPPRQPWKALGARRT